MPHWWFVRIQNSWQFPFSELPPAFGKPLTTFCFVLFQLRTSLTIWTIIAWRFNYITDSLIAGLALQNIWAFWGTSELLLQFIYYLPLLNCIIAKFRSCWCCFFGWVLLYFFHVLVWFFVKIIVTHQNLKCRLFPMLWVCCACILRRWWLMGAPSICLYTKEHRPILLLRPFAVSSINFRWYSVVFIRTAFTSTADGSFSKILQLVYLRI